MYFRHGNVAARKLKEKNEKEEEEEEEEGRWKEASKAY